MDSTKEKLVKGVLLENAVAFLKEKKGEAAITELEKETGPVIFDQYRMYPLEDLLKLQKAVVVKATGAESPESYKELGIFTFQAFTQTVVGATLTNIAHSPKALLEKIQEIWDSVANFGSRKLIRINEKARSAAVKISDDPRPPEYLQGVIQAGLESIGIKAETKIKSEKNGSYSIDINW